MTTVTFTELRANLASVLDRVQAGEDMTISRNGMPVADLTSHRKATPRTAVLYAMNEKLEQMMEEAKNLPLEIKPGFHDAEARVAELRAERDAW
ncbi:MAG: type II toxin-antitoxin system prevent-host-death family antitoxin [Propionibacteriaceae bacterium]|nr:type II toxin-antitoxin system prevent-host-death family antitoxin [Propionibacteriaceae bacterium]